MKKVLSGFLSTMLIISALSISVYAENAEQLFLDDISPMSMEEVSNPGVFEGINVKLNTYEVSHSKLSYWQFTLEKDSDVTIILNGPTNKNLAAVVYNEYGVYDSVSNGESSILNLHLKAGTYYIETAVNSIGEDSVQVGVFVQK